jgi:hypothetical protein
MKPLKFLDIKNHEQAKLVVNWGLETYLKFESLSIIIV